MCPLIGVTFALQPAVQFQPNMRPQVSSRLDWHNLKGTRFLVEIQEAISAFIIVVVMPKTNSYPVFTGHANCFHWLSLVGLPDGAAALWIDLATFFGTGKALSRKRF